MAFTPNDEKLQSLPDAEDLDLEKPQNYIQRELTPALFDDNFLAFPTVSATNSKPAGVLFFNEYEEKIKTGTFFPVRDPNVYLG